MTKNSLWFTCTILAAAGCRTDEGVDTGDDAAGGADALAGAIADAPAGAGDALAGGADAPAGAVDALAGGADALGDGGGDSNGPDAGPQADWVFTDPFDSLSAWDFIGEVPEGESFVSIAWLDAFGNVFRGAAKEKVGSVVGKAYVTKNFGVVAVEGSVVELLATYLVPTPSPGDGSIYLMDVECRDCGVETKPGIRILLRDNRLRVNLSKLCGGDDLGPSTSLVPYDEPFTIRFLLELGDESSGHTRVYLDGDLVIEATGVNMPLASAIAACGETLTAERFTYAQIGFTANSRATAETLYADDVAMRVWQ